MDHAAAKFILDRGHTGGRDVLSDILIPEEVMMRVSPVNDDFVLGASADDDEEDGFMEIEDAVGPLFVWRGWRRRK